ELLEATKNSLDRIKTAYFNLEHRKQASMNFEVDSKEWLDKIKEFKERFIEEMDDDFNTANAISILFDIAKEANVYLESKQTSTDVLEAFQKSISLILNVLGISIEEEQELLDEDIEALRSEERRVGKGGVDRDGRL